MADKAVGLARSTNSRTSSECAADVSISSGPANTDGDGDSDSSSADGDELGDPSAAGTGSGTEAEGSGGDQTSIVAVGVAAGLGTMALISCGVVVLAVRQRLKKTRQGGGAYRPAVNGIDGGGGGFEMSSGRNGKGSSSMAARHGGDVVQREEDFLQASPRTAVAHGRGGTGTGANATTRVFGRLLGGAPARAGFAAFENAD